MINKTRLIRLTQKLIRIDSQNPPGDEFQLAMFVKGYLEKIGVGCKIYAFRKKRLNVVSTLKGREQKRSLLITPHLDTVPCGDNWRFNPFLGTIHKGKIYGLGATDCKGNLASALEAINSLVEEKVILGYNLLFAATADEESGSGLGLIPLLDKGILKPDEAVVLDSDDFDIIVCQKGLIHLKVKIKGKRAHGAYPWRGLNAIDIALKILVELKEALPFRSRAELTYPKNKYLKPPTLNIGTIKGGDKVNIVADWCEFELDLRFLPGMNAAQMLKDIKGVIKKYSQKFNLEIEGIQNPYQIDINHPLVKSLKRALKKVKARGVVKGSEGATTITFFQDKGVAAVATGFGSSGTAHSANEYVKIENLYKGAIVLEEFLKTYNAL